MIILWLERVFCCDSVWSYVDAQRALAACGVLRKEFWIVLGVKIEVNGTISWGGSWEKSHGKVIGLKRRN